MMTEPDVITIEVSFQDVHKLVILTIPPIIDSNCLTYLFRIMPASMKHP